MFTQDEIKTISSSCSIGNHPVSKMPLEIRKRYLQALHIVLPMNDAFMGVLFKAWEKSILGKDQPIAYDNGNAKTKVKSAIKINRIGWHWFRLSYPFFFDCFYLTSLCKPKLLPSLMGRLIGFCNFITRKQMWRVYEYFKDKKPCDRIPKELLEHKYINDSFAENKLKRVLIVANVSAGKSTLINALIGHKLNKTATNACTKDLCYIYGKPQKDGLTIKLRDTDKYIYDESFGQWSSNECEQIGVYFASNHLKGKKICFIDTPGFNDAQNQERGIITEKAIKDNKYDAVLYIANGAYMGREDEQHLLEVIIKNTKKPIVFVMNYLDKYKPKDDSISDSIARYRSDIVKLGIKDPIIIPISARVAFLAEMEKQNLLDEEECLELEQNKKKFSKEFFNLPKYVQANSNSLTNDLIYLTGMLLLDKTIDEI